jgi:hypothetical protein
MELDGVVHVYFSAFQSARDTPAIRDFVIHLLVGTQVYDGDHISWWDPRVYEIVNIVLRCDICHSHSSHPAHLLVIVWNTAHGDREWAIHTWALRGDPRWADDAWGGAGAVDPMDVATARARRHAAEEYEEVEGLVEDLVGGVAEDDEEDGEEDQEDEVEDEEDEDGQSDWWSAAASDHEEEQGAFGGFYADGEYNPNIEVVQQTAVGFTTATAMLPPNYEGGGMGGTTEAAVQTAVFRGPVEGEPPTTRTRSGTSARTSGISRIDFAY